MVVGHTPGEMAINTHLPKQHSLSCEVYIKLHLKRSKVA